MQAVTMNNAYHGLQPSIDSTGIRTNEARSAASGIPATCA